MTNNAQKTPLARSVNQAAIKQVWNEVCMRGKNLPCTVVSVKGGFVTVSFNVITPVPYPLVTIPVIGTEYVRCPIQPGCIGYTVAADARLGGLTGLGTGTADLTPPGNLSGVAFAPLASMNWSAVDGAVLTLYGEPNVLIRDKTGATSILVASGTATLTTPGAFEITAPSTNTSGNLVAGTGCSGSFTTPTGQTVTVQDGIITNIY